MRNQLMMEWVRRYLNLGWSLIPLRPKSKEPLIPWTEFQKRMATEEEIKGWLQKWPDMNLGVITGHISSIVVVDLDGSQGKEFMVQQKLVCPCISRTGNGLQLIYKWKEHTDNSVSKLAPGVDIRADGGYVVVCPSVHPSGRLYRWNRFVPAQLPTFPRTLMSLDTALPVTKKDGSKPEGWISLALKEMKPGNIDTTLTSILGRMRHDGWNQEDAKTLLEPHAKFSGAEAGHLEEKIQNIWRRYEPNTNSTGYIQSLYEKSQTGLSIHSPADDDSFNKFTSALARCDVSGGTKTGFPTLDKMLEGGLKSERPFVIAARTGVGKTNFGVALSYNLTQQSKKVLYFSTEFKYQKVWSWFIPYCKNIEEFRQQSFNVCDSFNPNIEQIEKVLIEYKPDIFIFDYIQHISKEKEILTTFIKGCQFLQQKYKIQSIILAQLNRMADYVEDGKRVEPQMSMIEGSGSIEQAASRVLLLSQTKDDLEKKEIVGILAKNDQGDTGMIHFALFKNPFLFKELL